MPKPSTSNLLSKGELEVLAKIAPGLNYYQLLKVSPASSSDEVQAAFHREALLLHPDRYLALKDPELVQHAKTTYSLLVEAYRTLSNRARREAYDLELGGAALAKATTVHKKSARPLSSSDIDIDSRDSNIAGLNDETDENAITAVRRKPTGATTGAGLKFYKLAQTAYQTKDLSSAKMNIQIALSTDPKNPEFLQLSERIQMDLARKKS